MLEITEAGSYQVTNKQVNIMANKEVVLYLDGNCVIEINDIVNLKLHLINSNAKEVTVNSKLTGALVLTLSSFSNDKLAFSLQVDLIEPKAAIKMITATVSNTKSDLSYYIKHQSKETISEINNYGIGLKDSDYNCVINAKIFNKCKNSEAYQNSRILTTGSVNRIKVLPILQMEENQIKAKHACSIGKLDKEQQYYLALRGLNEKDIIQLVAKGYLSNVLKEIDNKELKEELVKQIESQVRNLC